VDDRRKRIKKYAFSTKNELVWSGEENEIASVGENILLRFLKVSENGYFYGYTLVRLGPYLQEKNRLRLTWI